MKTQLDDTSFKLKEAQMKYENLEGRYSQLEKENGNSKRKNEDLVKEVHELQRNLDKLKNEGAQYEDTLKRECEDARVEADDLSDLLKTKDRMLEDQNIVIANLKKQAKEKEDEVK